MNHRLPSRCVLLVALIAAVPAQAAEVRTQVRPGIEFVHRTSANPAQDIYAARIDLSLPQVGLHASADDRQGEWKVTTLQFAQNTGSVVAINGDFSNISASGNDFLRPLGLAISDGVKWNDHIHDDTIGGRWGFFGCTVDKRCTAGVELPLDQAFWFTDPTKRPYRFFQAIGANGVPLVNGGVAHQGCFDSVRNPRSAIGVEADGIHLWLVVIDGRRANNGAAGMTCDETRQLMLDLGASDAVMLDGGGSSTLVVEGAVKNQPSDGQPRTVGNHLGITWQDVIDPRCVGHENARFCDGTVITTCQGGRFVGSGDCGAFLTTCQEDGAFAFCVNPACPGGDGLGAVCADATRITSCNDGVPGTGDCGAFGLACGADDGGASCMDPRCAAGPHSSFCTAGGLRATCTDGVYAEGACPPGTACDARAGACVDPDALPPSGEGEGEGDVGEGEGEGEGEGGDGEGDVGEGEGEGEGDVGDGEGDVGAGAGDEVSAALPASVSSSGCAQGGGGVVVPLALAGLVLVVRRRR